MKFTKMEGCGNDFVVIDAADGPWTLDTARSRAICDRRRGVGADGVVALGTSVRVHLAGGTLVVHREATRYVLAGPAEYVFEGTL